MSATLHELRANLGAVREVYGRRSSHAERAFSLLCRAAADNGTPLDGLRHHVADEVERFFSYTIPGPDGHVYWDGPKRFTMNDGRDMIPRRWWFKHATGTLDKGQDLAVRCGEKHCINPEHMAIEKLRGYRLQWTDERALAAFQVVCMRLGQTPSIREWNAAGYKPSSFTLVDRFGGWGGVCRRAGVNLPPRTIALTVNRDGCIQALRLARGLLGRWPTRDEFEAQRQQLHNAGLPSSPSTIRKYLGALWKDCLDQAGREAGSREDTQATKGKGS